MATIPRIYSQRSLGAPGVVQYPTDDPVGKAVQSFGSKLFASASELLEKQREYNDRIARFDGQASMSEMEVAAEADRDKIRDASPNGAGIYESAMEAYDRRQKAFLAAIPESVRPEFEARARIARAAFDERTRGVQMTSRRGYESDLITRRTGEGQTGLLANPDALESWQSDVESQIDNSTHPAQVKEQMRRAVRATLQESALRGEVARNPARAAEVVNGWGLGRGPQIARERAAMTFFAQKGLSAVAAAAIVGRLGHESGMRTDARNPRDGSDGSDSIGLGQWNAGRAEALKGFAAARGKPVTDFETQLEFAWSELNTSERKALGMLQSARTPEQAARAMVEFERPRGWKPNGAYSSEDVSGWSDQLARAKRLMGEHVDPGDAGGIRGAPAADPRFADIPAERRMILAGHFETAQRQMAAAEARAQTEDYNRRFNDLQFRIIDGQATEADVMAARREGWLTDADGVNKLLGEIARRDKGLADQQAFGRAVADGAFVWNQTSKDHKDMAEAGFVGLGGTPEALEFVVDKTGIVPKSAATVLRGALASSDPTRVRNAMTVASNLMARNPSIFTGVEGGGDVESAAVSFRHYTERLGMTAAEAAQRVIKEQTPEHRAEMQRRTKTEDVDAMIRKEAQSGALVTELSSAFNAGLPLIDRPNIEFSPEARQAAQADYADLIRSRYLETGDMARAKEQAIAQMQNVWGVTYVNGSRSGSVVRFPIDRARALVGVPDVAARFAEQVIAELKFETGEDVPRGKLIVEPVLNGATARAYFAGQTPPYMISWIDKKGHLQRARKPFLFDADRERLALAEERRRSLAAAQSGGGLANMPGPAVVGPEQFDESPRRLTIEDPDMPALRLPRLQRP